MAKVTLCLVTYNRSHFVEASCANVLGSGVVHEIAWVDNASEPDERAKIEACLVASGIPLLRDMQPTNTGSAHGTNLAYRLATGDYLLVTDGDFTFRPGLLEDYADVLDGVPSCVVVGGYPCPPSDPNVEARFSGPEVSWTSPHGRTLRLRPGLPLVPRMLRRSTLDACGWIHEWGAKVRSDDLCWGRTCEHHCGEPACLIIPSETMDDCRHLPDSGPVQWNETDQYHQFKYDEMMKGLGLVGEHGGLGWPKYSPPWVSETPTCPVCAGRQ